jgi:hypothetical protein
VNTALDTKIIIAPWDADDVLNMAARNLLDAAAQRSALIIPGLVYAELLAQPQRTEATINNFMEAGDILVDWEISSHVVLAAGYAYKSYVVRRLSSRSAHPRRILADFLIGAHALVNEYVLLTLGQRHYRAAFPKLALHKI